MELHPPLYHSVVAIEKGAFGSPLAMVANFTSLLQGMTGRSDTRFDQQSGKIEHI